MDINNEIIEAINKNLPSAVGEVLQKRLAKAEEDAAKVESLTKQVRSGLDNISRLGDELTSLKDKLKQHQELDTKIADLAVREQRLEVTILTTKLEAQDKINTTLQDTLKGLVRNTEYRNNLFKSEPIVVPGSATCVGYTTPGNTTVTETKEVV